MLRTLLGEGLDAALRSLSTILEEYARRFVGHQFRISSEADWDSEVQSWLREAYRVGEQQGLTR
ncbi:MAG: hypothetical protein H0T64_02550 [Pyrinomonadaceae bacterium]|nr:hypothetical protein [Pyrinomonadaceae bacterium]